MIVVSIAWGQLLAPSRNCVPWLLFAPWGRSIEQSWDHPRYGSLPSSSIPQQ
jgi:hypothetical protein